MLKKILIISIALFSTSSFCMENPRGWIDLPKYWHLTRPLIPANKKSIRYMISNLKQIKFKSFECPICLDVVNERGSARILKCGDKFHKSCINPWITQHGKCSLCKKEVDPANPAIPIDDDEKEIIAAKNGILRLPREIVLEIIKFCIENAQNEQELKDIVLRLGQVNRLFRQLISDRQGLLFAGKNLETMRMNFYQNNNLLYKPDIFCIGDGLPFETRDSLLKSILNFAKNKDKNVEKKKDDLLLEGAQEGDTEKVILALSNGVCVITADMGDKTALMFAAEGGHTSIAKLLLNCDRRLLNKQTEYWFLFRGRVSGVNALMLAAARGHKEMVKLLLSEGANIHAKDDGETALMKAARAGDKESVQLLIKYGANINEKNNSGHTASDIATYCKNFEIVQLIEDHIQNFLFEAAESGNLEQVEDAICIWRAKYDAKDKNGMTVPMWAAKRGCFKIIDFYLINRWPVSDEKDNSGNTILMYAAENGHQEIVKLFTSSETSREKNNDGETALMKAVRNGHEEVVDFLIRYTGRAIIEKNIYGETSLDIAKKNNRTELISLLQSAVDIAKAPIIEMKSNNCCSKIAQMILEKIMD